MLEQLNNKIVSATKWSAFAEVIGKLVSPIISMILARLLTPEAFGIVAALNIVITFAEIFTDAGFQKYLVQHKFKDEQDADESTNVAFWSNLVLSLFIWGIIFIFRDSIAELVGSSGYGMVLFVACVSIPLAAFSSIQSALYKRNLDFKTLFKVRIAGLLVPIVVTIPLALWFKSYWALVIGTITSNLINAVLLTVFSNWKPRWFYSWNKLKEMFAFTNWSMIESVALWATGYVDVFIVSRALSQYYLGLYTTSISLVTQIMALVTTATTPILFSSLSKLQDNRDEFVHLFLKFEKMIGLLVIPAGVGIFCFSDLITTILLGDQWMEASGFIGLWGLTSAVMIVFANYCGEIYRSLGKPRLSVIVQLLHLIVLWPVVIIAVKYDFQTLYISRSLIRLESIIVNFVAVYFVIKLSPWQIIKNVLPSLAAALVMLVGAKLLLLLGDGVIWQIVVAIVSTILYFGFILLMPGEKEVLFNFINRLLKKK